MDGHEQLDGSSSIYTLDMDYNKAGSITFKNGNGSSFMNATALTYGLEYNYDPSNAKSAQTVPSIPRVTVPLRLEFTSQVLMF